MLKVPICAFTLIRIHKRHCYTWTPSSASAARCLGLPPDTAAAFLKVWSNRNKSPAWTLDRFRVAATTAARWRHLRCVMASVSVSVKCPESEILCPLLLMFSASRLRLSGIKTLVSALLALRNIYYLFLTYVLTTKAD